MILNKYNLSGDQAGNQTLIPKGGPNIRLLRIVGFLYYLIKKNCAWDSSLNFGIFLQRT